MSKRKSITDTKKEYIYKKKEDILQFFNKLNVYPFQDLLIEEKVNRKKFSLEVKNCNGYFKLEEDNIIFYIEMPNECFLPIFIIGVDEIIEITEILHQKLAVVIFDFQDYNIGINWNYNYIGLDPAFIYK